MEKENKHIYTLELTERQAKILSYACDRLSRIICGQDWTMQEFMEEAWEKRCKEATGKAMDKEWDGGWDDMRSESEELCKRIKKKFWGCESNAHYGIHYDDVADILFAMHTVIRHQLWLDRPDNEKSFITVDADKPMQLGTEPLAIMRRNTMATFVDVAEGESKTVINIFDKSGKMLKTYDSFDDYIKDFPLGVRNPLKEQYKKKLEQLKETLKNENTD